MTHSATRRHQPCWRSLAGGIGYEWRVAMGLAALFPAVLLPGYGLLEWVFGALDWAALQPERIPRSFELILPLAAGLMAAPALTVEREVGFAALRATYPEPRWRRPVLRIAGILMVTGAAALAGIGIYRLGLHQLGAGPYPVARAALPAVAPSLYLMGLSLLISRLAGHPWAATGAVLGYWLFEVVRRGEETGVLFLFQRTWPRPEVVLPLNRGLLAGVGAVLILAAAWHAAHRRG